MVPDLMRIRIGTAGWSIPRGVADRFPAAGSGLARYAAVLPAVEINSSFYRPHRPETYARWAASTPPPFRFSVKAPRAITHESGLVDAEGRLDAFLDQMGRLGEKAGAVLVQLPPSLAFDRTTAETFFGALRARWSGTVVCEPRHGTWFAADAEALLVAHRVARVAADPARHPGAGDPGGWPAVEYWRLHGSPRMYVSPYPDEALRGLAERLRFSAAGEVWCIFDNTASGAAAADALALARLLDPY
jgi:uncharacterized protein YecE (DUF72 family)